jgi:hypothetical protein
MHVEPHSWDHLLHVPAVRSRTLFHTAMGTLHLYDDLVSYEEISAMVIASCLARQAYHEASHVQERHESRQCMVK